MKANMHAQTILKHLQEKHQHVCTATHKSHQAQNQDSMQQYNSNNERKSMKPTRINLQSAHAYSLCLHKQLRISHVFGLTMQFWWPNDDDDSALFCNTSEHRSGLGTSLRSHGSLHESRVEGFGEEVVGIIRLQGWQRNFAIRQ